MADSISTFPGDCVVLIESPNPLAGPGAYIQGSGVVIGPHTILTASHVVFDPSEQTSLQNTDFYVGWNSPDPGLGPGYIPTTSTDHYYEIGTYGSDTLSKTDSASDYAVIDTSYTFSSWMGVLTNYQGGTVTATGYPATAGGYQTDSVGTVSADPSYSVLDYGTLFTSSGASGGPLWVDDGGSDDVVGVVSTGAYACQLTAADLGQIESWVSGDGYSLEANVTPVVTAVPSGTIGEGQSIAASSLIASVSNPNGDNITEDIYEDLGGGSGYFTVNGVRQPDDVWIDATPSENVQYVAGSLPGSDTLGVGIYDATTNSNFSTSLVATTIHVAPVVTAVPSISINEGQSIAASSLMSISNPSGDDILDDVYEDLGGGSGYFTVDGVKWTDGIPIYATPSENVQYVGGSSPGSDTLTVGIYDLTTGSYIYASNSIVATTTPITVATPPNFFSSLAEAGVLWQNSNGDTELWNPTGSGGFVGQDLGVVGGWQIAGTGAFNGASEASILWRNSGGATELWNSNGSGGYVGENLGVIPTSWQVAGTGDFNGAGEDILWRNSGGDTLLWNSNGSGGFVGEDLGVVPTSWQIAGTGDFTGTGEDSILWQNSNGDTELWNPNGSGGFTGEDLGVVGAAGRSPGPATSPGAAKTAFCGATAAATRNCEIRTARAGLSARIWASSPQAGRSPRRATSAATAKAGFCGATAAATRNCGTPTARAGSPARIWASSPPAGPCIRFSLELSIETLAGSGQNGIGDVPKQPTAGAKRSKLRERECAILDASNWHANNRAAGPARWAALDEGRIARVSRRHWPRKQ